MVGGPSLFQILELSLPILGTVIANKIWLKQKVKTKSIFPNQREMVNFGPKSKAYQGSIKLGKPTNVWVSFFLFSNGFDLQIIAISMRMVFVCPHMD